MVDSLIQAEEHVMSHGGGRMEDVSLTSETVIN